MKMENKKNYYDTYQKAIMMQIQKNCFNMNPMWMNMEIFTNMAIKNGGNININMDMGNIGCMGNMGSM